MLIVYEGSDEVLVCTKEQEAELLKVYFMDGGRNEAEYDRCECSGILEISTQMHIDSNVVFNR